MEIDGNYLSWRAQEEREAAMKAAHPNARRVHLDLADAYERRARDLAADQRRSVLRVVGAR
jgi:hypothetical protein